MQERTIKSISSATLISIHSNYLWFLTLSYSMVIVLANWFDPRLINIFGLTTDAGTLVFPLTFLLSDLITEVYGYKYARRAIWCGFLFNAFYLVYGQLVVHLPSPDFQTNNAMFDSLVAINARIVLASGISYLCSEPLNSYVMAKSKIQLHGRYMACRFVISTLFASFVDSFIFSMIAFYGTMNNHNLFTLIVTMWFIKVLIEITGLPFSTYFAKKLKKIDRTDIYDYQTNFNVFHLETSYVEKDNQFGVKQ